MLEILALDQNIRKLQYGEAAYNKCIQHKTFAAFIGDVGSINNNLLVLKILGNVSNHQESEMVFNMTQVEFDFAKGEVVISYFLEDGEYPDIHIPFDELSKVFSYAKKFAWRK